MSLTAARPDGSRAVEMDCTLSAHIWFSIRPSVPMSSAYALLFTNETQEVPLCRTLSVDLQFRDAPKDLMTKFVECLVRLPNLRTLEVFGASHVGPITKGLKRKCVRFPSVRELWISDKMVKFVGSCPNVESLITQDGLSWDSIGMLSSYRKELGHLKRVIGMNGCYVRQGKLGDTLLLETPVH